MTEEWKVFYNRQTGEELTAYTLRGSFQDEEQNTKELLAAENNIKPTDIETRIERRRTNGRY